MVIYQLIGKWKTEDSTMNLDEMMKETKEYVKKHDYSINKKYNEKKDGLKKDCLLMVITCAVWWLLFFIVHLIR